MKNHPLLFGRFSVLNGLRGVTLFWVMFVHLPMLAVPGFLEVPHNTWRFGVDFFFAISGFLVTRSLYQCLASAEKKGQGMREGITEFLIRRVARIFPPYYFILGLLAALALATRGGFLESLRNISGILASWPLFFANYAIPTRIEEVPHTLIILWSVSFQEQFYFLLAMFFVAGREKLRHVLFAAGLFSIVLRLVSAFTFWKGQPHTGHYEFWLHLNFDGLSWGCLAWIFYDQLGWLWKTRARGAIATALLLAGDAFVISAPGYFAGDQAWVLVQTLKAPLFALTVRAACELEQSQLFFARFLRGKWIGEIGVASFEVYLLHVILYGFLEKLHLSSGKAFLVLAYSVSLVSGMVFYQVFGKPSQEIAKKWLRALFLPRPVVAATPKVADAT